MEAMSMLNVLAEIATEKLQTDPVVMRISKIEKQAESLAKNQPTSKPHNRGKQMTLLHVSTLSDSAILRLFAVSQANELKRKFYYTCRFLPSQCEETFHSFASEDKARNQMKKHLKDHLQDLLHKFKDIESRENYILSTVEKAPKYTMGSDSKSVTRKPVNHKKSDLKPKSSNEKENASVSLLVQNGNGHSTYSRSNVTSSSSNSSTHTQGLVQPEVSIVMPENSAKKTVISNGTGTFVTEDPNGVNKKRVALYTLGVSVAKSAQEMDQIPNQSQISTTKVSFSKQKTEQAIIKNTNMVLNKYERPEHTKKQSLIQPEKIGLNTTTKEEPLYSHHTDTPKNSTITLWNWPTYSSSSSKVSLPESNISLPDNSTTSIAELLNTTCSSSPSLTEADVPSEETTNENIPNQEMFQSTSTEFVDIKMEENIKLEVLDVNHQLNANTNISHDHGYMTNKDKMEGIDDVKISVNNLDQQVINRKSAFDYLTNGIDTPKGNSGKQRRGSDDEESAATESQNASELLDPPPGEVGKKVRAKGKGKFIGQSKDEMEQALTLIDQVKSQAVIPVENFQCNICKPPRVFTAHSTLVSHYKSHAGIRPYVCSLCQAVFTRQHSLNYHLLIHSNQTRFTCDDCGRKFRHPSHFKEHRRRHTGECPYECTDCHMRFKTRNTYKRHLRTRHGKKLTTKGSIYAVEERMDGTSGTAAFDTSEDEIGVPSHSRESAKGRKRSVSVPVDVPAIDTGLLATGSEKGSRNSGNDEFPQSTVPFYEINVYDTSDKVEEGGDVAASFTPAAKEYHELMPLEVSTPPPADLVSSSHSIPDEGFIALPFSEQNDDGTYHNDFTITALNDDHHPEIEPPQQDRSNTTSAAVNQLPQSPAVSLKNSNGVFFLINSNTSQNSAIINASRGPLNGTVLNRGHTPSTLETGHSINGFTNNKDFSFQDSIPSFSTREYKCLQLPSNTLPGTDVRPIGTGGSILGSLLTAGSEGSKNTTVGARVPPHFDLNVFGNEQNENADKWDSLMREVVSLSSAVKVRPHPQEQEVPAPPHHHPQKQEVPPQKQEAPPPHHPQKQECPPHHHPLKQEAPPLHYPQKQEASPHHHPQKQEAPPLHHHHPHKQEAPPHHHPHKQEAPPHHHPHKQEAPPHHHPHKQEAPPHHHPHKQEAPPHHLMKQEAPSSQHPLKQEAPPSPQHQGLSILRTNSTPTRDNREVFVLKYVNGTVGGNPIAKVFRAKPLLFPPTPLNRGGGPLSSVEYSEPKPILITSSVRHCGPLLGNIGPVDAVLGRN